MLAPELPVERVHIYSFISTMVWEELLVSVSARAHMSAFVCGLDVHKDSTYATILDCAGRIVGQRMVNDKVLSYLSAYRISKIGMGASNQIASSFRQLKERLLRFRLSF